MGALQAWLEAIGVDRSLKEVVLAANGTAFWAGHDLKEVRSHSDEPFFKALFEQCSELMLTFARIPQLVIARVHAMATAAGCQLVASCDLAVAAEGARFATPGVNIGLFCSTPMVAIRSEEHTSELQSLMRISYAVFCLKKKKTNNR